jgi:solute carrier family 39 (zinc transporter), member 1/2/3
MDTGTDPCIMGSAGAYDMPLHIAAIFIILATAFLGASLPLLNKRFFRGTVATYIITTGKCAGTGIVLSCALIHMLQPANESLTSPCVPAAFNLDYTAYAFLFALLAALTIHLIENMVMLGSQQEPENKPLLLKDPLLEGIIR